MQISIITPSDELWNEVEEYAENFSWSAGKNLSSEMKNRSFSDWERVIVCFEDKEICGYCTVAKRIVFLMFLILPISVIYLWESRTEEIELVRK